MGMGMETGIPAGMGNSPTGMGIMHYKVGKNPNIRDGDGDADRDPRGDGEFPVPVTVFIKNDCGSTLIVCVHLFLKTICVLGVFTGATTLFFAYIGFDTVSTAAQEAKNPQRDMPLGIILSLLICTILYIAVSIVLVGLANYTTLNTAAPLTDAIRNNLGWRWLTIAIEIGVISGRIFYYL
jgi:amino acid transporter